jgi:hypothetical protein
VRQIPELLTHLADVQLDLLRRRSSSLRANVTVMLTLWGQSKTRNKAGLQTMCARQRDRLHAPGEADSQGLAMDRRDGPHSVNGDEGSTFPLRGLERPCMSIARHVLVRAPL